MRVKIVFSSSQQHYWRNLLGWGGSSYPRCHQEGATLVCFLDLASPQERLTLIEWLREHEVAYQDVEQERRKNIFHHLKDLQAFCETSKLADLTTASLYLEWRKLKSLYGELTQQERQIRKYLMKIRTNLEAATVIAATAECLATGYRRPNDYYSAMYAVQNYVKKAIEAFVSAFDDIDDYLNGGSIPYGSRRPGV
jgi:hypothetical protein